MCCLQKLYLISLAALKLNVTHVCLLFQTSHTKRDDISNNLANSLTKYSKENSSVSVRQEIILLGSDLPVNNVDNR